MVWMVLLLAGSSTAPEWRSESLGNVWVETAPVRLQLRGATTAVLRAVGGGELLTRPVAGGAVDFGQLPPGAYEAVAEGAVLPLVVLIDPTRRVPGASRLATDHAGAWLVDRAHYADLARLLRLCGFGWVRERLAWGQVEPRRGSYEWGQYETAYAALHAAGLQVYPVFHGSPGWSRADGDGHAAPDDLRDIHRFAQALATQFRGRVGAWEVWNEPDISFFRDPASECAAFQKAAWLGFRAVDRDLTVLGPSLAHGAGAFADHLLANGSGRFMDVWNYHIYDNPQRYAARHQGFAQLLERYQLNLPSWVTEAGDAQDGPDGILAGPARQHQAAFIGRSYALALAAGIERHFWFVFPFYKEGTRGWGLFEPHEQVPFPGVAAISTATYACGRGDYLGRLRLAEPAVEVRAFARGDGSAALVVWREDDQPAELTLPLEWAAIREARSHLGTPLAKGAGTVRLTVDRAPVYLLLAQSALPAGLEAPPGRQPATVLPPLGLPQTVTRLRPATALPVDKGADAWLVEAGREIPLELQVYQFGPQPLRATARLLAPAGWNLTPAELPVQAAPGERFVAQVTLTTNRTRAAGQITVEVGAGTAFAAPAAVDLLVDPNTLEATASRALALPAAAQWQPHIAGHGKLLLRAGGAGGLACEASFATDGDNWFYPAWNLDPPLDLSRFAALRFEYRSSVADAGPLRLMLREQGGGTFMTAGGLPGSTTWRQATVVLSHLAYMSFMGPDADGQLDTARLDRLQFGANAKPLALTVELRNLQAVAF
ncbi:MAG: hypothetical protein IT204_03420 [Fimbriimonadaceae bacterium]|nr:hypothetical protein [Fimbriimonadaceae bacterium]